MYPSRALGEPAWSEQPTATGMGGHCAAEDAGQSVLRDCGMQGWGGSCSACLIIYSSYKWPGVLLRDLGPTAACPGATHTLVCPCTRRGSSLLALALAWLPSHICTAGAKARHFQRTQFFESEPWRNICLLFFSGDGTPLHP